MPRAIHAVLIPAFFLFAAIGADAAKITADPNAPGARREAEVEKDIFKADPRLEQKVTIEAKRKSISAILTDLAAKTGITFKAGSNEKDWQVRDRRMNIFAKDIPLADLMRSIARVMKFQWLRGGNQNEWHYRLYMDRKTLLDEEAMQQREQARRDERETERRAKAIEAYTKLGNLSPAELAKLKKESPLLYIIAESGASNSLGAFFNQVPAAGEAFATGQELNVSAANLSSGAQQAIVRAMQDMNAMEKRFGGGNARALPSDLASNIGQATIRINQHLEDVRGTPMSGFLLGEMSINCGDAHVEVPLFDPDSSFAKLIGKALIKCEDENRSMDDVGKEMQGELVTTITAEMKRTQIGEPEPEHPDDPKLHEKIKPQADTWQIDGVEQALADASKLAVVADSFGNSRSFGPVRLEEAELKDVLDKIAAGYQSNWELHSPVIEFRDKQWFRKRAAQVPDEWIDAWKKTFKETGTLDIDDLAQIASFTTEQLDVNIFSDEVLRTGVAAIYGARDVLRFYSALSSEQRAALFSQAGLDAAGLSPEQWAIAQKLITRRNAGFLADPAERVALTATREQKDKVFSYRVTATSSGVQDPITYSFETPRYTEPKPPPAKTAEKPKQADEPAVKAKPADPDQPKADQPKAEKPAN